MWIEYKLTFKNSKGEPGTDHLLINSDNIFNFAIKDNILQIQENVGTAMMYFESNEQAEMVYEGFKDALNGEAVSLDVGWISPLSEYKRKKEIEEQIEMQRKRWEIEQLTRKMMQSSPPPIPFPCHKCGKHGGHETFEVCLGRPTC